MQKIIPSIWCSGNADEMAEFYVAALPATRIAQSQNYPTEGLPEFQRDMAGKTITIDLEVGGYRLNLLNGGDEFAPNPSISFMLDFDGGRRGEGDAGDDARAELDRTWAMLAEDGQVMIPLGEYPYSPWYGWVQDRFGVSWQLMLAGPDGAPRPPVVPNLMFCGPNQNRASDALTTYAEVFGGTRGTTAEYAEPTGPANAGAVMFGDVELAGQWFAAMDSGTEQDFTFSEGISLIVQCENQDEIDRFWNVLSQDPSAEQCGWCRDAFGVSWQVVPKNIGTLLKEPGAFPAMLQMKKIVIADLHG
jgi:predicted 3-demethylubiquinone-9 3-methyltransferase (glyoxalase superfamily)